MTHPQSAHLKQYQLSLKSLEIKREMVQRNMDNGLLPYTKRYLGDLSHHFATIGLVGMNEALMNFFDTNTTIATEEGKRFALKILDFMREKLEKYQKDTGNIYNLEATPAEGTSYRLAQKDKDKYPEIFEANREVIRDPDLIFPGQRILIPGA